MGFSTAGGKALALSAAAQQKRKAFINNLDVSEDQPAAHEQHQPHAHTHNAAAAAAATTPLATTPLAATTPRPAAAAGPSSNRGAFKKPRTVGSYSAPPPRRSLGVPTAPSLPPQRQPPQQHSMRAPLRTPLRTPPPPRSPPAAAPTTPAPRAPVDCRCIARQPFGRALACAKCGGGPCQRACPSCCCSCGGRLEGPVAQVLHASGCPNDGTGPLAKPTPRLPLNPGLRGARVQ